MILYDIDTAQSLTVQAARPRGGDTGGRLRALARAEGSSLLARLGLTLRDS